MSSLDAAMAAINRVLWHDYVMYFIVGVGVLFTIRSGFAQFRALTHGTAVLRGRYDDHKDPGAISHFQALSAALSATVGLGNIGGVALAIALGGPGAVFWMWVIGFIGMALKLTEVTLAMLYRNTDDPDNPHGGSMWVAARGVARARPQLAWLGKTVAVIFCLTLLVATATGGNMFQAWNVATLTGNYFGVPGLVTGVILAVAVGLVIIGGIRRIGAFAGRLVPAMVALYLLGGCYVLFTHASEIPAMFALIFTSAFTGSEASGAFLGASIAYGIMFGMKRAIFSNEVGQGTSPIAHCAARTDEPAREGVVAGLEPFIDTLVVCTFTSLVILSSGVWNRAAEATYTTPPTVVPVELGRWSLAETAVPPRVRGEWAEGDNVFLIFEGDANEETGNTRQRFEGTVGVGSDGNLVVRWTDVNSDTKPVIRDNGLYATYVAAALTARAFDTAHEGLGKYLITIAAWLFALTTMISWSYYGEQGVVFLAGDRAVLAYKVIYCVLIVIASSGFIETDTQLDHFTGIGMGVMLLANMPILLIFGGQAIRAYHSYIDRLKSGALDDGSPAPSIDELLDRK